MPKKAKPIPQINEEEILVNAKFFQGNESLLGKNAQIAWTPEMLEENKVCSRNIIYFAERHFFIITDNGKEKIKLRDFQKEMLRGFKRDPRNVVLSSRQSGKTTTVTVYALWKACFNEHYKIAIVANKGDTAKQILARIKLALEGLPIYLKPGIKSWRKDGVELDNGSSIIISSTSVSSIRGSSVHCLILDEMAHCPNELMQELWQSIIPTISASKKGEIIAISTPNGADKENKFYQLYLETQKPNSIWKLHRVDWWEIPGRDDAWKKQEIETLGSLDFFLQEYENCITGDCILDVKYLTYHYKRTIENVYNLIEKVKNKYKVLTPTGYQNFERIRKLKKKIVLISTEHVKIKVTCDHPFVVDGEIKTPMNLKIGDFLEMRGGKKTLINNIEPYGEDFVYDLINVDGGNVYYANDILVHNCFHPPGKSILSAELLEELKKQCKEPIAIFDDGNYKIYEMPQFNHHYAIGVDVGEGIGRNNSIVQVIDITDLTNITQVAEYASNIMTPYHFGSRIMGILEDWGRPPILVEGNSYGQQILDVIARTHMYENVVSYKYEGMSKHYDNSARFGVYSHTNTKYKCMTNFRYWIDALKVVKINSFETLKEIAEFIQLPNYTFTKKNETDQDDRVWGLAWALFILEPLVANQHYIINSTDEQGRPLSITPFIDNNENLKKSQLFKGSASIFKKQENYITPFVSVPTKEEDEIGIEMEQTKLQTWLTKWNPTIRDLNPYIQKTPEVYRKSNEIPKIELEEPKKYHAPPVIF